MGAQREDRLENHIDSICPFCLQEAMHVTIANCVRNVRLKNFRQTVLPVICALEYDGFVRTSIRHWKYDGLLAITPWFGSAMTSAFHAQQADTPVDIIVPVPASADRLKKRGYDQVGLLSKNIQSGTDLKEVTALKRRPDGTQFTQSQTAKSARERRDSLQGKYVCTLPDEVKGRHILLIDDVVTTGATMQVCADILLNSGAQSVLGLVVAYVR